MDIGLGPDQQELRDNVRDVLAAQCSTDFVRRCAVDVDAWTELWKTVSELGWAGLVSYTDPDLGYSAIDLVAVLEQTGAAAAPIPFLSSVGLAGAALRRAGDAAESVLEKIAEGASATAATQGVGARVPDAPFTVSAGGTVSGTAIAVADATRADHIVAIAAADDPDTVTVAVLDATTCRITPGESVDPGRPLAEVSATDVTPLVLATADRRQVFADQMLCAAAELVGVAGAALDMSVAYASTRVQFDKPIGAFQSIKHLLADTYVSVERARSLTYSAAAVVADPGASSDAVWTAAALAKAAAGDAALTSTRSGVQVHGAIAQTWEHDMHLFVRRAWSGSMCHGESNALYGALGAAYAKATS